MKLKYVGEKGRFIPGVPLRDLSDKEVNMFGADRLLASGLYKPEQKKKPAKKGSKQ